MPWIRPTLRHPTRVTRGGRVIVGLAAVAVTAMLSTACAPPVPPVDQPPPQGLPSGVPAAATRPEPALPVPAGWPFPDHFPHTSGTGRLTGGATEWSDFIYDDHGAIGAPVGGSVAGLAPALGTYAYPAGNALRNGADIFRLGIGRDGSASYWRVDWNTLADPTIPVIAFAIDADGSAVTGVPSWGGGTGLRSAGIDHVLIVSSRGAWVIDAVTGIRTALGAAAVTVDHVATRAMGSFVARVPSASLPALTGTWRVRAAAGLATPDGSAFAPVPATNGALAGQPAVYNMAFRTPAQETQADNFWMERAQATALTTGDVSAFSTTVDWAALSAHQETPEPVVTGYSNRWYVSSLEPGKGVVADDPNSPSGDLRPNFLGRVQPYAAYVPTTYRPGSPTPVTWMLHSLGVNHNQYGALNPKFIQDSCEKRHSICATTLGRGPDGWYFDEAEVDFWQVWHALATSFDLDPERTVLSGYSMGGWAGYKLGLAYPDLFAKTVVIAGPQVCGIRLESGVVQPAGPGRCTDDGLSAPLLGNARWLPYYIGQGAGDELVPVTGVEQQVHDLDALGYRYRYEQFPSQDHLVWATEDLFASPAANMGGLSRTHDPGRITYSWFPNLSRDDLGIGPTGVYWIRGLHARDQRPGRLASLDVTSSARPDPAVTPARTSGPLVTSDTPPLAGTFQELAWQLGARPTAQSTITAQLTNVSILSYRLGRAGIAPGQRATLSFASDGPVQLGLSGLAPGQQVRVGATTATASATGTVAVSLPAGSSSVQL